MVESALRRRGEEISIQSLLDLDQRRRQALTEVDNLRSRRNEVSKDIGHMENRPDALIRDMREIGSKIKLLEDQTRELDSILRDEILKLPNLPLPDVPSGLDESGNQIIKTWGTKRSFDFKPKPHWELADELGLIDFRLGPKISGSRFFTLAGVGATMHRALVSWMLDMHTREHGYQEMYVPYLVREEVMLGSGNLPKFGDNLYHDEEDDLWLIPTAEVPLTGLHRDDILETTDLPIYYVSHTPCFRREKAAAGRDTRGIKRVHQFDKVEMYKLVEPQNSSEELDKLVDNASEVCRRLEIPYRVLQLCAGDMGFPSAMSYDLEMWAPGSQEWLEVSSCSNCTDFQSRRSNIRYRPTNDKRPRFVHTLNGSGLALPRVIISIIENYQQKDGTIYVPDALRPYMGIEVIEPI